MSCPSDEEKARSEARIRIQNDPDFVMARRYGNSLAILMARHPDGLSDKGIAQALMLREDEVAGLHAAIVAKMRDLMGV